MNLQKEMGLIHFMSNCRSQAQALLCNRHRVCFKVSESSGMQRPTAAKSTGCLQRDNMKLKLKAMRPHAG